MKNIYLNKKNGVILGFLLFENIYFIVCNKKSPIVIHK